MAAEVNIVEAYGHASIDKKIEIILDNFSGFTQIIASYESYLKIQIRVEREYNRRQRSAGIEELGVKVQTSGCSSPTERIGIENVEIEKAIKAGNYEEALKGADDVEKHRYEFATLENMRDDYEVVSGQVYVLQGEELELFKRYLARQDSLVDIADKIGVQYDSAKQRMKRYRRRVKEQSVNLLESKYKYV